MVDEWYSTCFLIAFRGFSSCSGAILILASEEWAHLSWYSRVSLRCWMRGTWNFKMKYCFNLCRETSLWAFVKVLRANKFGKLKERKMSHSLYDYTGTACYFVLWHTTHVCRVSPLLMLWTCYSLIHVWLSSLIHSLTFD